MFGDIELISSFVIPAMMNKNKLCTINNWATMHWSTKSKLKNQYKELLIDWFLNDNKIPEDAIFVWKPEYKDNRKRDSINLAAICKIVEDVFREIGALDDDDKTSHVLLPGSVNKNNVEHKIKVEIYRRIEK